MYTMEVEECFRMDLEELRGYTSEEEIDKAWKDNGEKLISLLWDEYSIAMTSYLKIKDYSDEN